MFILHGKKGFFRGDHAHKKCTQVFVPLSGKMKIDINFLNDSYDQYEGIITSQNFSLINAPGIINSLSI